MTFPEPQWGTKESGSWAGGLCQLLSMLDTTTGKDFGEAVETFPTFVVWSILVESCTPS
jgi:hypothetical protein